MPPERWLELTVRSALGAELLSPILFGLGGTAVEESRGALVTYLLPPSDPDVFLARVRARLNESYPAADFELGWRWQPQKDWESFWRRGLGPRRITPRILVVPSWEEVEPQPGEILLNLDPGMAFGTAEHATTRGCLRLLDSRVSAGSRIADVGAGSGILSIAAARLGAKEVLALEMDAMSCETAVENAENNGVSDRVSVLQTQVDIGSPLPEAPFDGIVANLQSHILFPLFPTFLESLLPRGWVIMSGILLEERQEILAGASAQGFAFLESDEEDGWWTGLFELAPPPL